MSYRRQLLARYSRRDRLSMVLIGVSVAFLTGSALLLVSATDQLQTIAADFDATGYVTGYQSVEVATRAAGRDVVFPVVTARIDGANATVLGVPPAANTTLLEATPESGLASALTNGARTVEVAGIEQLRLTGRASLETIPDSWYLAERSLVERLAPDSAIVLESGANAGGRATERGIRVPLRGAGQFFVDGTRQALSLFGVIVTGVAGLVGIIVYSVTRMSIRDRAKTIRIVRATGATPREVRALFTARAALVTSVGIALGYAVGLIAARVAVNVSVFLGLPVSLDLSLSWPVVAVLVPLYGTVLLLGGSAGYFASRSASRVPPARVRSSGGGSIDGPIRERLPDGVGLTFLRWRSVIPTIATVTVFLTLLIVLVSAGTAVEPTVDSRTATVVEPGSIHPVASEVPESFATVLDDRGIDASPEILLFPNVDGTSTLTRGVDFPSFAAVSDAAIRTGRAPQGPDEAVVGEAIAARRNISVGETVLVGGSTRTAFTRPTVVGVFEAPGFYESHLLVSLSTARELSNRGAQTVHVVRASRLPDSNGTGIEVVDVSVPNTVIENRDFQVTVTAVNLGRETATRTIPLQVATTTRNVTLTVPSGERVQRTVTLSAPAGSWSLQAGSTTRSITAQRPDALGITFPDRVRVGSTPRVDVETVTGEPVGDATVSLGNRTVRTSSSGTARIEVSPGADRLTVTADDREAAQPVTVIDDRADDLRPLVSLSIEPASPGFQTRPTAELRIENPWERTVSAELTVRGPERRYGRPVTLELGETTTTSVQLSRNPPGEYDVTVTDDEGAVLARQSMVVTGNERLVAALATHGQQGSTPFSRAVSLVFGNLSLLIGAVVGLGALMTVGGLTAIFSRGVHARRRTIGIYRATGATPRRIFGLVVRDAVVIGTFALVVAFPLSYLVLIGLASLGVLTAFGVSIQPLVAAWIVGVGAAIVLGLVVLGAILAAATLVATAPATVLTDDRAGGVER